MMKNNIEKEEFIHLDTTLYTLVNQFRLGGDYVKKCILWNAETILFVGVTGFCREILIED